MISARGWMREGNTRMFGNKYRGFLNIHEREVKFVPFKERYDNKVRFKLGDISNVEHPKRRGIVFTLKDGRIYTFASTSNVQYVNEFSNIHRTIQGNRNNDELFIQIKTLLEFL